jgi:hypothetical protein
MAVWIQRFWCLEELLSTDVDTATSTQEYFTLLPFSPPVTVFKHPVALRYLLCVYFRLKCNCTLLPHYMFRLNTAMT